MYELIQLSEHDYYVDCPAKIGLVRINESDVILIDSGNDKDAGKKVLRIIESNGWTLNAIYNTHSHADHIGGNKFLQDRTGCRIYARGIEAAYTNYPQLEPIGLYGGLPMKDLRHKFLMAQPSRAQELTEESLPKGMKLLELPGHCADMVGFLTADGNAYIGDCVSSSETLEKYGIGYLWNPAAAVKTLEEVKKIDAVRYIPAHAAVSGQIAELADLNIRSILAVRNQLIEFCEAPTTFEKLLKRVFEVFGLKMNMQQYALIGSTVRAYLTNLYEEEKITISFADNEMCWMKCERTG